jgi:hypothetical protein
MHSPRGSSAHCKLSWRRAISDRLDDVPAVSYATNEAQPVTLLRSASQSYTDRCPGHRTPINLSSRTSRRFPPFKRKPLVERSGNANIKKMLSQDFLADPICRAGKYP